MMMYLNNKAIMGRKYVVIERCSGQKDIIKTFDYRDKAMQCFFEWADILHMVTDDDKSTLVATFLEKGFVEIESNLLGGTILMMSERNKMSEL